MIQTVCRHLSQSSSSILHDVHRMQKCFYILEATITAIALAMIYYCHRWFSQDSTQAHQYTEVSGPAMHRDVEIGGSDMHRDVEVSGPVWYEGTVRQARFTRCNQVKVYKDADEYDLQGVIKRKYGVDNLHFDILSVIKMFFGMRRPFFPFKLTGSALNVRCQKAWNKFVSTDTDRSHKGYCVGVFTPKGRLLASWVPNKSKGEKKIKALIPYRNHVIAAVTNKTVRIYCDGQLSQECEVPMKLNPTHAMWVTKKSSVCFVLISSKLVPYSGGPLRLQTWTFSRPLQLHKGWYGSTDQDFIAEKIDSLLSSAVRSEEDMMS